MQIKRFKDIVAFRWEQFGSAAKYIAMHAQNLEVAEISPEAWESMADETPISEILNWNSEVNTEAGDISIGNTVKHLTINITQICNLGCAYCAAGGDGTYGDAIARISVEKTLPQLKFFIDKLNAKGDFNLTLLGGEPLLYPEGLRLIHNYLQLLTAGTQININYNVITNGTLLTDEIVDLLCEMKAHITVSIDGKPEVQDRVRPMKNGGSSSIAAITGLNNLLKRKSELGRLLIHSVFTKEHTAVLETYLYLQEFAVDNFEFTFDVTEKDEATNLLFLSEMQKVAKTAWEKGGETELRKVTLFDGHFNALDAQLRKSSYCGSGKSLLSIDSKNRIFACPLDVEDKSEQVGIDTDINHSKLAPLQASFIETNNCQSCWARNFCGGGCLYVHKSLTGKKNKKHDSFCERQRGLLGVSILYYQLCRT